MASFDEDRILVEEAVQGRIEAFDQLIRKYQKKIFYFVTRILKRPEDSDEVTQKTFIQAYTHLGKFRFESSFKTWIMKIALNLSRNYLRAFGRKILELDDQMADPASQGEFEKREQEEEKRWLERSLEELPAMQKEVIVLRIYEELSFKEIAGMVSTSEGSAKVNFHHGMKRLKELHEKRRKKEEIS